MFVVRRWLLHVFLFTLSSVWSYLFLFFFFPFVYYVPSYHTAFCFSEEVSRPRKGRKHSNQTEIYDLERTHAASASERIAREAVSNSRGG